MRTALAKTLFREGVLRMIVVTEAIEGGFNMAVKRGDLDLTPEYIETARGEVRRFKTADAALKAAKEIGFKNVVFQG